MKKPIWIAIDGPAGSGKSTIANELLKRLNNFIHINTGAMYRATAYFLLSQNIDFRCEQQRQDFLQKIRVFFDHDQVLVEYNNETTNVTGFIYNEEVAKVTSSISVFADVRQKLVHDQQTMLSNQNVIMDGRDIGTVVIPNATLKIYLDASIDERALRRIKQLNETSSNNDLQKIKEQIKERDHIDKNKPIGALKQADDAIVLHTDNLSIEQTCDCIIQLLNEKLNNLN